MPSTTLYIWAQSGELPSQKNAQIRPRFFSFNWSATLFPDNLTHPHTIEFTKFGIACDNIIIPMEAGCERLNSLDCNPEPSTLHHSSSLGLGIVYRNTLDRREWLLHLACGGEKKLLLIFGIISGCCWDCAQVWQRTNHWIRPSMG